MSFLIPIEELPSLRVDSFFRTSQKFTSKFSSTLESFEFDKESVIKQELIGNCMYFCLISLLGYIDVVLNKINKGGFGTVYLCSNEKRNESILYAVKCIKFSKTKNSADREQQFGYISKLNSEYLVKYLDIFTFNKDLYVVMPYFANGSLYDFVKRYREENQKIEEYVYFYFI
jgi:hypothetical protein